MTLYIDPRREEFVLDGKPVHLTGREREVLALIMAGGGRPVQPAYIAETAEMAEAAVKVHVLRLRRALGPDVIVTHHGVGYAWHYRTKRCQACGRAG